MCREPEELHNRERAAEFACVGMRTNTQRVLNCHGIVMKCFVLFSRRIWLRDTRAQQPRMRRPRRFLCMFSVPDRDLIGTVIVKDPPSAGPLPRQDLSRSGPTY